tara:strand:- start:2202 stop:2747 length:546 start_codon:yes stop_codon:yes gene_type:complete
MAKQSKAGRVTKIGPRSKGKPATRQVLGTVRKTLKNGKCSKGQLRSALLISQLLGGAKYEMEATWDWLVTSYGTSLYADIYFPKHNLVVEYHGQQHFIFPNFFHKTKKDFDDAVDRDFLKKKLLKNHKIKLIEWRFDEPLTEEKAFSKLVGAGFSKSKLRKPQTSRRSKRSTITRISPRSR